MLTLVLEVNGAPIHRVHIVNKGVAGVTGGKRSVPICRYEWLVTSTPEAIVPFTGRRNGHVYHNPAEGALVLSQRVLADAVGSAPL